MTHKEAGIPAQRLIESDTKSPALLVAWLVGLWVDVRIVVAHGALIARIAVQVEPTVQSPVDLHFGIVLSEIRLRIGDWYRGIFLLYTLITTQEEEIKRTDRVVGLVLQMRLEG